VRQLAAAILIMAALAGVPGAGGGAEAPRLRMVVADLPYARVWDAALRAVADYPLESAGGGRIVTGWRERPPREGEPGVSRVTERVTLGVVETGVRITLITVDVEARGWRDGEWVALPDTGVTARAVLARLRDAQG
jgi:hypothetical protein